MERRADRTVTHGFPQYPQSVQMSFLGDNRASCRGDAMNPRIPLTAFSIIMYRHFGKISGKKRSLNPYRKLELALAIGRWYLPGQSKSIFNAHSCSLHNGATFAVLWG